MERVYRTDLKLLRYFLAVARERNITGAANYLHLTQPTLSRQIHDLEKELGQQLLIRKSHRVELTPEGVLLRTFRTVTYFLLLYIFIIYP